jgi:hypothetical protein
MPSPELAASGFAGRMRLSLLPLFFINTCYHMEAFLQL